jgi:formate dehydrogenase subunit delta
MDVHHLVHMANNIGSFFEAEKDKAKGVKGVADHIRNFWEPRMRREILAYLDREQGSGLSGIVLDALRTYREDLTPKAMV